MAARFVFAEFLHDETVVGGRRRIQPRLARRLTCRGDEVIYRLPWPCSTGGGARTPAGSDPDGGLRHAGHERTRGGAVAEERYAHVSHSCDRRWRRKTAKPASPLSKMWRRRRWMAAADARPPRQGCAVSCNGSTRFYRPKSQSSVEYRSAYRTSDVSPMPASTRPERSRSARGSGSRPMKRRYNSAGSALLPRDRICPRN